MKNEPLNNHDSRQLIRQIVKGGSVVFSNHVVQRLDERGISEASIYHALKSGWVEGCDFERGSWRYRVVAHKLTVVIAFDSETKAIVITAWE